MAGQAGENEIADAVSRGDLASPMGVWERLAQRLREIPAYVTLFQGAYPAEVAGADDINFTMAANAMAAFEASAWAANNSPFDRAMAGEVGAMSEAAQRGMALFQQNGCGACHSGRLQTDDQFHAIAMPQIGPGKGDNSDGFTDGREDFGREKVTGNTAHRFQFRTPSLRNVELTAPYGHAGAYSTLEAMVGHYVNPVRALNNYDRTQVQMPSRGDLDALDFVVLDNAQRVNEIAQAARNETSLRPRNMSPQNLSDIVEFLRALTDPASVDLSRDIPSTVPSGLSLLDEIRLLRV
jgi:cytochrome c peroxidase